MPSLCPGLHMQHSLLDGFLKLPTSLCSSPHTLWLPRALLLFLKIFIWLHPVLVMVLRIFVPVCGCVPVRGFFHCGAQASLVVARGLSCPAACGILVPWPGIKPVSSWMHETVLRAGAQAALGRPRGMGWRGRQEGGSGWGTHVNPWLIHVSVWQKHYNIVK